jgi:hypothetical protein
MPDELWKNETGGSIRSLMPRAVPNAGFVRDLEAEIRRAARRRMGRMGAPIGPKGVPFEEMVIELRKLVRLLHRTLVPVQPRLEFSRSLGEQLQVRTADVVPVRQQQWRWLMVGGLVGSLLSVLGLVAALLLRRRNGRLHAEKTVGVT